MARAGLSPQTDNRWLPTSHWRTSRPSLTRSDGSSVSTPSLSASTYAFQDFDREFAELPGEYAPPGGRLLLTRIEDRDVGCIALRPLSPTVCEMKRLYVRPESRGLKIGRRLAEHIVDDARCIGYLFLRLDTVPSMQEAITLYRSLDFVTIPPYRHNPVPGALFFELRLE